ncbi:hypothetical protein PPYR_08999 [Photinus pyralis]|uniref:Uncharacterized protein n=1 Tax=Photinus pyralis TaxID=7054 RepID=A0A5N4AL25_PHOPY|nr:uncharacterized protein LOC116172523 [Photinus pyralis]XP_031345809.1 uncharacterized protein LOC116172697 [Photinus pyralis]KAB0798006.1 hypothetical protein PPYR_08999 [Photinus pyralis]
MHIKVLTVLMTVVIVRSNPIEHKQEKAQPEEDNKTNDYSFSYGVKDMHTGDVKDQWEKKEGGVVKGQYSMMEADGSIRTVDYVADKEHGFHAYVKFNGNQHPLSSSHQLVHMEAEKLPKKIIKSPKPSHEYLYKPSESRPQPAIVNIKQVKKAPSTTKKPDSIKNEVNPNLQFPLDLSFLETNNKVIPLQVSKLNPVEIKVSDGLTTQQQHKIRKPTENRFNQQFVETDFQPIVSNLTYKTNKKPLVTPGLRNYASPSHLKTALQQEIQSVPSGLNVYKHFPDNNRPSFYMQPPRQTKNTPTLIKMKYH